MSTLSELYEELSDGEDPESKEDELEKLLSLHNRLLSSGSTKLRRASDDHGQIHALAAWISRAILPDGSIIASDGAPESDNAAKREARLIHIRRKGTLGLKALRILLQDLIPGSGSIDNQVLLTIIAYTSPADSWTTSSSVADANVLLSIPAIENQIHTPEFLMTYLLQSFIRPLFTSSKPSTITSASRKAAPSTLPQPSTSFPTRASQPWKYHSPHSLPALDWAVRNISSSQLATSWHLLIPPILTLLDTVATPYRFRGLLILSALLPNMELKVLLQTGLGSVFEDAVTPTSMFIPTITELEESVFLLPSAYSALFALFRTLWPSTTPNKDAENHEIDREKYQFLDRMLRKGILPAYQHCSTIPEIVEILLVQLRKIVELMGMYSVKHLSQILPLLGAVLTDPFASSRPNLLLAGTKCLQAVVFNSWPRMIVESHRREVIKMLCLCWKHIGEAEEEEIDAGLAEVRKEMKEAGRWFVAAAKVAEEYNVIRRELGELVGADRTLIELFGL